MSEREYGNISVVVVSSDPYFLFAARGLLGRSREVRIRATYASLQDYQADNQSSSIRCHAVICDLDSVSYEPGFYETIRELIPVQPECAYIGLVEGNVTHVVSKAEIIPLRALLFKTDLSYCLHLAIRAVVKHKAVLVTEHIRSLLHAGSFLSVSSQTIGPHQPHPALPPRLAEIVTWRIFVGLDNADIQDELLLEHDTVRAYVWKAYKALGVHDELSAFEALSDWWWATRFLQAV